MNQDNKLSRQGKARQGETTHPRQNPPQETTTAPTKHTGAITATTRATARSQLFQYLWAVRGSAVNAEGLEGGRRQLEVRGHLTVTVTTVVRVYRYFQSSEPSNDKKRRHEGTRYIQNVRLT